MTIQPKLLIVVLLAVGIASSGAAFVLMSNAGWNVVENENTASTLSNNVRLSIRVENQLFYPWDDIDATLAVKNEGNETVALVFRDSQIFDLFAYDENFNKIYAWSSGKGFLMKIGGLTLEPENEYGQTLSWENRASDLWGTFYLQGKLVGGWWENSSGPVRESIDTPLLEITVIGPSL